MVISHNIMDTVFLSALSLLSVNMVQWTLKIVIAPITANVYTNLCVYTNGCYSAHWKLL